MIKLIAIPFSIITYSLFFFFICLFHPIQYVCYHLFGYEAHRRSVDIMNGCLLSILVFMISTFEIELKEPLPKGKPIIFVANHQGLFDIIGIGWFLRKFHPKFVSKVELGKGIPSVSFNLNHGGSVLIDRKDPKQALPMLKKLGEYIEANNRSAVIFPEGTRTKTGEPKSFAPSGLKILCKYAPNAYVVPITINNSWKVYRYGGFPLGMGSRLKFTVHAPLSVRDYDYATLFEITEKTIVAEIVY